MSSVLTPEYVLCELEDAQRMLDQRRLELDKQIRRLENETVEQEAAVRELLRLIQKQGLSPLLEQEYQRANTAWSVAVSRLASLKKEAETQTRPQLTEAQVRGYLDDMRALLREGQVQTRQALLRRFIRSIVLYPNHAELHYTFGLSALAPLGGFGGIDSPSCGAPRATRTPAPGSGGRCSIH